MIPSNFHTHTTRCHHANGTEREYIESAIEIGMTDLGFSDHCPIPFKTDYVSSIRMTIDQLDDYVSTLRKLSKEYAKDINIYVGLEMEYIPEYFNEQIALFDSFGIDYLIMGEHFIENEENGAYSGTPFVDKKFLSRYVDTIIEGMKTKRFSYLAHPDLINFIGEKDYYEKEMTRLCLEMKALNIPLEVNALGYYTNRHYPNNLFWDIAAKNGCDAIVGIDAHDPICLKSQEMYDAAVNIISSRNMNQVFLDLR